jgi:hypothetical protein
MRCRWKRRPGSGEVAFRDQLLLDFQHKRRRVPPHDRRSIGTGWTSGRPVQARLDRSPAGGDHWPAIGHAAFAKAGAPNRGLRVAPRVARGIKDRPEHIEPAFDRPFSWSADVARPRCGNVCHPDRFCPITAQLLFGRFQQLDRGRAAKRLCPQATMRVDMTDSPELNPQETLRDKIRKKSSRRPQIYG